MKAEKTLSLLSYFGCVVAGIIRKPEKTPTEIIDEMKECCIELEALQIKVAKWDMIQWAVDECIEFVATEEGNTYLIDVDLELLERLYKEREQNEG